MKIKKENKIRSKTNLNEDNEEFSDRRLYSRIATRFPIVIRYKKNSFKEMIEGKVVNLSERGISFIIRKVLTLSTEVSLEASLSEQFPILKLKGNIIWVDFTKVGEDEFQYGVRFYNMYETCQKILGQFIGSQIIHEGIVHDRRLKSTVKSDLVNFKNVRGKNIVGFYDHSGREKGDNYFVIFPPRYGETKKSNLYLSYFFVENGFQCLRYDNTDNIGDSEGRIANASLSKMENDLVSVLNFVEQSFAPKKIGIVASSLSARVVLKLAGEDKRINAVASVVGVINIQETLKAIYQEDLIRKTVEGKIKRKKIDAFGFEVNANLKETIKDNYHSLETSIEDVRKIDIPIIFLVAENDVWVKLDDVKKVFDSVASSYKEIHFISGGMHQLNENPKLAELAARQTAQYFLRHLVGKQVKLEKIFGPNIREVAIQDRVERERSRNLDRITREKEMAFWRKYLNKFNFAVEIPVYRDLSDAIRRLLGNPKKNETVLDAGCGDGSFGICLLVNSIRKIRQQGKLDLMRYPYSYVGIDYVKTALVEAKKAHLKIQRKFKKKGKLKGNIVEFSYFNMNLGRSLNFPDNYFDKICCNLVISYVDDPLFTIREFYRVLKFGGKMVITSLKPNADLSQVYQDFVDKAKSPKDIEKAIGLLNNAGLIKQKEGDGHYRFFSRKELIKLMDIIGGRKVESFRSLGNQVNMILVKKGR